MNIMAAPKDSVTLKQFLFEIDVTMLKDDTKSLDNRRLFHIWKSIVPDKGQTDVPLRVFVCVHVCVRMCVRGQGRSGRQDDQVFPVGRSATKGRWTSPHLT